MKSILVPVGQEDCTEALRLAAKIAIRFGGLVEGIALRHPLVPSFDWGIGGTVAVSEPDIEPEQIKAEARALFISIMEESGVPILEHAPQAGETGALWTGGSLFGNNAVGAYARAFALTCVPQPRGRSGVIATLEAALFDSGGPIMIAPPQSRPSDIGETIAVAWNGSDETARTLAFAGGFLQAARRVVVLADESGPRASPSGALMRRRLAFEGVPAELRLLPKGGVVSGETILKTAEEEGCDMLVKGAYTQSRIRQIIFGGATKHILSEARIPVLMAH